MSASKSAHEVVEGLTQKQKKAFEKAAPNLARVVLGNAVFDLLTAGVEPNRENLAAHLQAQLKKGVAAEITGPAVEHALMLIEKSLKRDV
jgi:uncharacterized protein YejL (UPF0352 family)